MRGTALVVEDDFLIATDMEAELQRRDYPDVVCTGRVADALEIVASRDVAVAVLDIDLGGGATSAPVARELRARGIPFVFVSGNAASILPPDLHDAPHMHKPVDWARFDELMQTLAGAQPRL